MAPVEPARLPAAELLEQARVTLTSAKNRLTNQAITGALPGAIKDLTATVETILLVLERAARASGVYGPDPKAKP